MRDVGCNNMTSLKSLTIWIIVLNFFIIIGAGHGIGCIGIIEILSLIGTLTGQIFDKEDISFSLTSTYDKSLLVVGLFSLIGQLLLIISLITKKPDKKVWTKIGGLIFLLIGFYYLTHNYFNDDLSKIGFFTGLPFLICSLVMLFKLVGKNFIVDKPV